MASPTDQISNQIYLGDCNEILKNFPSNSIDLIVTSPPYAYNRKSTYGGVPVEKYVIWFLPISQELKRVLKPTGSFVFNVKERVVNSERHTYVIELILEMKKQGWLWIEEYIWHKKNCYPGKWNHHFRDAWERCLHFTKEKEFNMFQDEMKIPMGAWADKRLTKLSETDKKRDESKSGSHFGKNVSNWVGKTSVYPTNVLHIATECANRNHSAAFPLALPSWFIRLFTREGDIVLDPFMGVGTTAVACINLNRKYVGIEKMKDYHELAMKAVGNAIKLQSNELT